MSSHDHDAALRARIASLERQITAIEASPWWLAGAIVREGFRHPARLPRLLAGLFRALFALLRPSPGVRRGEALARARRYDEAVAAYDRVLARNPADVRALRRKREAQSKMGDLSGMLETVRQMRGVVDSESLAAAERAITGRLRELDPTWLPELPGAPTTLEPASPGTVLHILKHSLPYHTNGYTVRSRYTLLAQRDAGLEPVVVTSVGFPRSEGVADPQPVESIDGIAHHRLDLGPDFDFAKLPLDEQLTLFAWMAGDVVRRERPAVIHARSGFRGYETALVGLALGRHFDIPVVYEISSFLESTWTGDIAWAERGELYRLRFEQENRCMREAAHVVTIAESMRQDIVARGIAPDHVSVVPNAVDARAFAPRPKDAALVDDLRLAGKVVLGYISNLGAREGIDVLIGATALLAREGRPVACVIAGEGPERPALEALVASLGVADHVHLLGSVPHDRVKDIYALIDVFVVPRRDDRAARLVTPLKPYEAMAMGKPLLVASLPALAEIVGDDRGLVFEQGSPEDLAAKASTLIGDEQLRARLGEQARAWVMRERTWTANGERYRSIYEQAIAEHASARHERPASSPAARTADEDVPEELRAREERLRTLRAGRWTKVGLLLQREARTPWKLPGVAARGVRAWWGSRGTMPHPAPPKPGKVAAYASVRGPAPGTLLRPGEGSLLERGTEAMRLLSTHEAPALLGYWPLVLNNPFQEMLYGACWEHGIAPIPVTDLAALDDAPALSRLGAQVWLHVHWTAPVLQHAGSRREAREAIDAFAARLDALRATGGRIAWTVHNVLPHEARVPEMEAEVCRVLTERADVIHVLCERTPALTEPHYTLPPEKVRVVPHASYVGVYPDNTTREAARYSLGLRAEHTVFAAVGGIRRYKGIGALLDAFEAVQPSNPHLRLIIAGRPIQFPGLPGLRRRCEDNPAIITRFEPVPDDELQRYLGAADVVVLPYADVLNSGVLMLAATFGRPVIAADRGCVGSQVSEEFGILFEPDRPHALEEALLRAEKLKEPRFGEAARRYAASLVPPVVAERFATILRAES